MSHESAWCQPTSSQKPCIPLALVPSLLMGFVWIWAWCDVATSFICTKGMTRSKITIPVVRKMPVIRSKCTANGAWIRYASMCCWYCQVHELLLFNLRHAADLYQHIYATNVFSHLCSTHPIKKLMSYFPYLHVTVYSCITKSRICRAQYPHLATKVLLLN